MLTAMNEDIARTCFVTDPRVKSFTTLSRHPGVAARPIIIDLPGRHSPRAPLDESELTEWCPSGIRCDFFRGVNPPAWGATAEWTSQDASSSSRAQRAAWAEPLRRASTN